MMEIEKHRKLSCLFAKTSLIVSVICLLTLQKNTSSSAISILRVDPSVVELENQAFYNLRRGKFLEVFKKCEELLKIDEKSIIAYEMLGIAYAGIGRFDKAQEIVVSVKEVTTHSSLLYLCKGMILHSQKKYDKAIEECQKSITLDQDNPLALYVIGRIYIDKKDYKKAEVYLRKATENEPELAAAYTGLGINYLLQGNIGESFNNYNKALEIDANEHLARMGLATIFIGLKAHDNAIEQYSLVIKKIPTFIRARQNLATLYLQIGRFEDAIEQSSEILNFDSNIALSYLILARSYSYTNNFDEAIINIKKFISLREYSFEGNYLLGIFQIAKGDIQSSKNALEKARKIDAKQGNIMIANALISHIEGNYNKTEIYLKDALDLTPKSNHPVINIFLTNLYLSQNKHKKSIESLNKSIGFITDFRPENLDLKTDGDKKKSFFHTSLAIFFHLNRWHDKAISECDAALNMYPKNPITLYIKGKSLIEKKDFSQASSQFQMIVESQPDFISPYYDLAKLYLITDEINKALEEYKKIAKLDPKDVSVHLSIGNIYAKQGKNDEAITEYKQVIALAPDSPAGYNELAYHYAENETNLDEGLTFALKASQLSPEDASILDTLGWVYFKKGAYVEALESLKSANELSPDSPTVRYHLGMAYYKNNDLENALNEFKNSLIISGRFNRASQSQEMIKLIKNRLNQTK